MIILFRELLCGRNTFKMTRANISQTPYARVTGGVVRGAVRRRIMSPVNAIESTYTGNIENAVEVEELLTPSKCIFHEKCLVKNFMHTNEFKYGLLHAVIEILTEEYFILLQ